MYDNIWEARDSDKLIFNFQMLSTVLNIIMFEECRNQWSMSRPLLGLILLSEEVRWEGGGRGREGGGGSWRREGGRRREGGGEGGRGREGGEGGSWRREGGGVGGGTGQCEVGREQWSRNWCIEQLQGISLNGSIYRQSITAITCFITKCLNLMISRNTYNYGITCSIISHQKIWERNCYIFHVKIQVCLSVCSPVRERQMHTDNAKTTTPSAATGSKDVWDYGHQVI